MKTSTKSSVWVAVALAFTAIGMVFIVHVALPLPSSKLIGGFLLAIGAFNLLFSRMLGSSVHAQTSDRPILGWFWIRCGEKGSQLVFIGIAATLAVAGCVLLVFGAA